MSAMSGETERPKCDNSAGKDSESVATDISGQDSDEIRDTHTCGLCHLVFDDLEVYIKHKLFEDNCKVKYTKSQTNRRVLIPHLVKVKKESEEACKRSSAPGLEGTEEDNENRPAAGLEKKTARYIHKRWRLHHSASNIIERPSYRCDQCPKTFTREAALKRHIEFDHGKPLFSDEEEEVDNGEEEEEAAEAKEVDLAAKTAATARSVGRGARTLKTDPANEIRPFACQECDGRFKEASVLKAHMLTHGDLREFPCTWEGCGYAFKTKGSLVRHMRRHTGERPFKCNLCWRTFGESGALTRHLRSRTPCKNKTDNDLPRYGKRVEIAPNQRMTISAKEDLQETPEVVELHDEDGLTTTVTLVTIPEGDIPPEGAEVDEDNSGTFQIAEAEEECSHVAAEVEHAEETTDGSTSIAMESDLENLPSEPNQCRVCRAVAEDEESLREHLKTHLADVPFRCGLCAYATSNRADLELHRQWVHNTGTKDGAVEQLRTEVPTQEVEADTAEKSDPSIHTEAPSNPSEIHQEASTVQESQQKATVDPKVCSRQASIALKQLLELQNTQEVKVHSSIHGYRVLHKCPVCNRSFRGSSYLKLHMRSHTGERPHSCNVCLKTFSTKDTLTKHMHCHTEERQYQCGECGKLFKRISHVREHLKIHSNERPFHCSLCDKAFKTSNACKVHLRTHTDLYPFECPGCHRTFREKGSLERHVRTHTGEKPFSCKHCCRHFAEHGTLNRHLKAKVPCTRQLALAREQERVAKGQVANVTELSESGEEVTQVTEVSAEDLPTVLAEFSSVVADTQQYIMEPDQQNTIPTEFVMVTADGETQQVQNIEVLTEEQLAGRHPGQLQEYVLLKSDDQPHITISMVNAQNGNVETMQMFADNLQTVEQPLTIVNSEDDTIQTVTMVAEDHGEQVEVVTVDPDAEHDVSISIDPNNDQIETVAMVTAQEQIEPESMAAEEEVFHTVTVMPDDENMETVETVTTEEHVIEEPGNESDTVQQAMLVAEVVESLGEELH